MGDWLREGEGEMGREEGGEMGREMGREGGGEMERGNCAEGCDAKVPSMACNCSL